MVKYQKKILNQKKLIKWGKRDDKKFKETYNSFVKYKINEYQNIKFLIFCEMIKK